MLPVKKIEKFENGIMLVPINKAYEEKFYTNEEIENPHNGLSHWCNTIYNI